MNHDVRACYIYPPIGNYTTHVSGCDLKFAKGAGRPNCWQDRWTCPGTIIEDDPQKRQKLFMAWDGDKGHTEVGSAVVDINVCDHIQLFSFWEGPGAPPHYRVEEDRRQHKVLKRPAGNHAPGVEPSATSKRPKGKGKSKYDPPTQGPRKGWSI